jgi:penicillin-binding protein 1A
MATDVDPSPSKPSLIERRRLRKSQKRSVFWRWRRLFFLMLLLVVAALAGVWLVLSSIALPDADEQLAETTFICTREVAQDCNEDSATAQLNGEENRILVDYEAVPEVLIEAVIAAEDQDYFNHNGIDPIGITRAAYADIRGQTEAVQGGSTITQQYVKNVFLTNERTLVRKLREAVLAVKLEDELDKEEILERYLNTVYFGRGAYGVEAAAKVYYGKDVGELTIPDAAYLAGLIRAPETADAEIAPEEATFRRNSVLDNMLAEEFITAEEHLAASQQPWDINPFGVGNLLPRVQLDTLGNVKGREYGTEYFAEYVRQQLVEIFNGDEERVYGGGLRVYTTLDHEWQRQAYETVTGTLRPEDPSAAIVAIGARGRVRAMMAGTNFTESEVNLAVGAEGGGSGRQPGSSFKPFALTEALRQGYSVKAQLPAPSSKTYYPYGPEGEPWVVTGGRGQGSMPLDTATQFSNNVVYAGLMLEVGTENVIQTAGDLGLESEVPTVPSIVLGSGEVSVLDMASAYTTFRERGVHHDPVVIERVENSSGDVLWEADSSPEQVLSEEVADTVTYALQKVVEAGTGTAAGSAPQEVAGKTGTTDDNKDAWFVGYSCDVTAAVWMGNIGQPGEPVAPMNNVQGVQVQGGNFPARMWAEFMTRIDPLAQSDCAFAEVTEFPGEKDFDDETDEDDEVTGDTTVTTGPAAAPSATTVPQDTVPPPVAPAPTVPVAPTVPSPTTIAGGGDAGGVSNPQGGGDDP